MTVFVYDWGLNYRCVNDREMLSSFNVLHFSIADCDVNCHKKCEKLAANLCGVNQKLIVEALASVRQANQGACNRYQQIFMQFVT